jgi:diguanylate cyclase (GGDEF)-like protein/PAS domain S-box-containing protein
MIRGGKRLRTETAGEDRSMDVEHAEQALRRSEEWFRAAFDQAAVGVAHTSPDGRWLRVNQRLCDLLGYTREELGRRTFQDLTHPDDLPADLAYTRQLLDGEIRTYSMEKRYVRRDGSHVWVDLTVSLTREPSGQPDCFIAVVVDITDRKRAEEELRRSEERFRSLVQNASDVVTVIDADGITRYVSPSVERVLGYRPEDRIGASVLESSIIHPDDADTVRTAFAETLRSPDRILTTEFRARHADGSWRDLEAVARNLLDDPGVEGIVVNYRDITERKRAEEALSESEGRFRALFERSPDGILLFDPHDPDVLWRIVDCNEVAARMNGYARGDLIGRSINVLIGGKMCRERAAEYLGRLRTGPVHDRDVHVRRDGTAFPIEYSSSVISVGGRELVLGIDRDITEREHAEEALRRSQASLANTQRIAHLGSWEWNLDRNELAWSDEVYRIFGLTPQEFAATNEAFLDRVHPDDRARVTAAADAALTGGGPYSIDHRIVRPGGEVRFVHEQAEVILAVNGRSLRMVGAVHDVTERKVLEERLKHQAFHDPLTGLPNRTLLMDRLEHALARATRRPASVAVLFLDLDRFKFVNDSLGHEAGDQILVALAARLRACLRPQDTIARLSGDEFTILLEDIADTSDAIAVAERVGEALCAPFECGAHEVLVTTTIGIAFSTAGHGTPEDLLRAADVAMYSAKSSGKAQFKIFEVEMGRQALDRLDLEADLRRAIERDEFGVYYQPEVELDTGRIVGMEALVRWERPGGGPMEPEAFIPLAEETGLILPIERLVLRAVAGRPGSGGTATETRRYPSASTSPRGTCSTPACSGRSPHVWRRRGSTDGNYSSRSRRARS